MTVLSDIEIASENMISPFVGEKTGSPSYGSSSYGYDIRLGEEFVVYNNGRPHVLNPSRPEELVEDKDYIRQQADTYYRLPSKSFILAHSQETLTMPDDVVAMVKDKSTYARLGVTVQNTVIEPGWSGQITLEITNHNSRPVLLLVGLGIAQVMFWRGKQCQSPYRSDGKYQHQTGVVMPR
tara:strand:- start:273 stop:815 length:543 start_codon:yes stop_codon:yes gene_type:complete